MQIRDLRVYLGLNMRKKRRGPKLAVVGENFAAPNFTAEADDNRAAYIRLSGRICYLLLPA